MTRADCDDASSSCFITHTSKSARELNQACTASESFRELNEPDIAPDHSAARRERSLFEDDWSPRSPPGHKGAIAASKEIELHTAGGTSAACMTDVCGTSINPQPRRMDKHAVVDDREIEPPADRQRSDTAADNHVVIKRHERGSQRSC